MKGRCLCALGLAVWAIGLSAQVPDNFWFKPSSQPGLTLHSGAMVLNLPAYPGSSQFRSLPFPILNGEWEKRVSFGASRFGVGGSAAYNVFKVEGWTGTLGVEGYEPRPERMANALAGMGNRPATTFAAAGLAWRTGPFGLEAGLRKGFRAEAGGGAVLRTTLAIPLGRRWLLEARVAGGAYDRTQMAYEYGINADQAGRRHQLILAGDPRLTQGEDQGFATSGGWALLQSSVAVGYALTDHWRLGVTFLQQEVQGLARRSPLVVKPRSQGTVIGFSYQL